MSIRLRLTLTYSIILVVILLVFSASVISILHWTLLDSVDRTLDQTVNEVVRNIQGPEVGFSLAGEPTLTFELPPQLDIFRASNVYVQVWTREGRLTSSSGNLGNYSAPLDEDALSAMEQTRRNVIVNGFPLRVLTRPLFVTDRIVGRIQVAEPISAIQETERGVTVVMVVAGFVAFVISLFLGNALIEHALRPIENIAEAASQIATGDDLSRRIPYDGPLDELGKLTVIFNATLSRLEQLFTAQRRFVADVSHELRTPLTVIQGNVDIIRRYGPDDDSLDAISSESKRMTRMVGDLLLLAQADSGQLPLLTQNLELDSLVLEIFEQAKVLVPEDGTAIRLGRFEPVRVHADPDRLKQLLLNLVGNAIKYTPPEGAVTLSVWPDGPEAMMTVQDTGEGIPAEDLPHVFERFYRVDKARARKQGGAGLGLAIAHWIAEAHGGRITVSSTVGVGTTFTVRLPRQIPAPGALLATPNHRALRATNKAE
ncbi:MAG: HAMP domain-containing protein [Anaerolineae bacterium]|nr:HAMP domain-containing protein [Anaerolineae bacterium]